MAVVNTKSTAVANADAAVQTLSSSTLEGKAYHNLGSVAIAAGDDDGSTLRLMRVHSSWRLLSCLLYCDAITAAAGWTLGLYRTAADGGAQVGTAVYSPGVTVTSAILTGAEALFSANRAINKIGQQVWQDAGLTADPNLWYDLTLNCVTAGTAAGNIAWNVEFMKS